MTTKSEEKEKCSSEEKMEELYRLREIYMRSSMWIAKLEEYAYDVCPTRKNKYKYMNGKCAAGGEK